MARKATIEASAAIDGREVKVEVVEPSAHFGRPLKFNSADDVLRRGTAYFDSCREEGIPLTVTGLCLHLGTTRETFGDYISGRYDSDINNFSDTFKRLKMFCENYAEQRLYSNQPTGAIFALKNHGWTDRTEQIITTNANSLPSSDAEMEQKLLSFMQKYLPKQP